MKKSSSNNFHLTKKGLALSIFAALVSNSNVVSANSTQLWLENFNDNALNNKGAVNNVVDMENVTNWSINVDNASLTASSDWFKVTNKVMEARDVDGIVDWFSESIDIAGKSNVRISVKAYEQGTHEADDFFNLAYSIDGSAFVSVSNWEGKGDDSHTLIDDFTSAEINVVVPEGSSLVIKASMRNGAGSEYIRFDDVTVSYSDEAQQEPSTETTITNACFNCPDLTKINSASDFVDSTYYETVIDAINAEQDSSTIKTTITDVISDSHKRLSYSEAWTALTKTDEDPLNNNNVILFYSGISKPKFSNGSGSQSTDQDNWNREHVWAKSHGFPSSSASAYSDIHHLRPTDISINASRGNLDFDNSDSPLSEAPENRVDGDSFEPRDAVKGDVARIVFYMDTRYEGFDSVTPDLQVVNYLTSSGQSKLGKLCTLLSWNENDPVDEFELKRNNTIYEFQGNRNPFIDHPEWVSKVYTQECSDETNPPIDPTDPVEPPDPSNPASVNLFFSEYVEGSGFNKAVEIYNPTSQNVDLSEFTFKFYSNGSATPTSSYTLSGQLTPNNVIVIGNSNIDPNSELFNKVDVFSSAINYNGDDYIELTKGDIIVDSAGHFGVKQSWGANTTLVRKSSVTQGVTDRNIAFDRENEWESNPSNTFTFLGNHIADDVPVTPVDPEPVVTIGQCYESATLISSIQGSSTASDMVGQTHTIEGVVTSVVNELSGYFIQEESVDEDSNAVTSEGIFVFDENTNEYPNIGDTVRVNGDVKEFYNRTQIDAKQSLVCDSIGQINHKVMTLPVSAVEEWESVEGMLISFSHSLQVTDTYNLARFGQLSLSNGRLLNPTNVFAPNSSNAIALADKNKRNVILLDDKNNSQNPEFVPFPAAGLTYTNTVRLGDTVNNLEGIVDYSFSSFRILPTQSVDVLPTNPRNDVVQIKEGNLKVASFNVLNYFNGDGLSNGFPTSRGASTADEFERQSAKIVAALADIDADIIGLMEIENDGFGELSAIADLVKRLNVAQSASVYQYVSLNQPALGSDQITVGLLYKTNSVSLSGNAVTTNQSPFDYGNRQPLVQSFIHQTSGEVLTIAVNHFKSKGSCSSATGSNADTNDGQGCWNELRTQASNALVSWLNTNPTGTTDSDILILGDLNAYAKEDPISAIESQGYKNLIEQYQGVNAYSYSFGGELGYLDHALASSALAMQVVDTKVLHINADEPRVFDYNTENKSQNQLTQYYGQTAFRSSDHDPIVVSIALASENTMNGDFDNDQDIDRNDLSIFMSLLRSGKSLTIDNDFNQDGLINTRDVRALMSQCTRTRCATE